MRVLPPLTITEAMITSSSAPEEGPAVYNGSTTYALGDQVSVADGLALDVYESLQASNTAHTPSLWPAYWQPLGRTWLAWNSGATYAEGDIVLDAATHQEYESLQGSNLNHAITDAAWWYPGPSNRWRMFDLLRNTGTTASSPLVVQLTPGERVGSIGLVGLVADEVTITVTVDGETVYSRTVDLSARNTTTWYGYFFGPFTYKGAVAYFDLPPYTDGIISVTLTRSSGDVTCGGMLVGRSVYLGITLHDAENDALNFSTVERDEFGNSLLVPRRTVPKTLQQVRCAKSNVNTVIAARTALNAVPALWSGLDDADSGYFEAVLILGIYKRFSVTMDQPNDALISLELEEV